MADFDPMTALQQGANFQQSITDNARKTAAYNALLAAYGPAVAGDPDTALKGQEFQQRDLTNPIAVQQAGANLKTTQQENDYNALANPKKLTGLDLTNENTQATTANTEATTANTKATTNRTNALLPGEVSQQGATLAQTRAQTGLAQAQTATSRLALNTAQAAQDRQTTMGILAGLSDTASSGGDIGAAFDKISPLIAKMEGHDGADMSPLRAALIQDPVGTINRLTDAVHAANLQAAGGGTGGKSTIAGQLALIKVAGQQMSLKDGLNFTQQRTAAVPQLADDITALVPKMSSIATIREIRSHVPGTPEYQYQQKVEQLKPNLSLDDIRNLKAGGLSMGRVTNQEMSMAGNAIANMDIGQPLATLTANAQRVKNTYVGVNADVAAAIKRAGNGVPGQPGHISSPQQNFVKGQTYVDGNGKHAVWTGNNWQTVQ